VWALVLCGHAHQAHAEDPAASGSPTVLSPHRIPIAMPPGWTWKDGSFVHTSGARATLEVSAAFAAGVDVRYCEMQVGMAQLDILGNAREGDVPEDLGPPPMTGWSSWLPVNDGKDIMTCGRVALPVDIRSSSHGPKDIKVTLTGRDLGAGKALVTALAQAQPAGAKPPPREPSTPPTTSTPRSLRLPLFDVDLRLPDDGMTWELSGTLEHPTLPGVTLDRLTPANPPLVVAIRRAQGSGSRVASCSALAAEHAGRLPPLTGLPSGWLAYPLDTNPLTTDVCIDIDAWLVVVQFASAEPTTNLAPFAPLLKAIEAALRPPVTPSVPGYSYSGYEKSLIMASGGLEVPVSWRASSDETIPSLRVSFSGFEYSWLIAAASGFVHRGNFAAAVDLFGVLSDDVTLSPRFGGQHVELGLDFGFAFALGDTARLGLTAGWHGVAGPITKNSSLALSAIFASCPDEGVAFSVRVTPVQLLAANERELMSPLTVDVRVMLGILALGLEVQYIAPPEPGDEDIPAEAMAFILRFGAGFGRPY
jgi:hypothetical protein